VYCMVHGLVFSWCIAWHMALRSAGVLHGTWPCRSAGVLHGINLEASQPSKR